MPPPEDIFQNTDPQQPTTPLEKRLESNRVVPTSLPVPSAPSNRRWLWPAVGALILIIGVGTAVAVRLRQESGDQEVASAVNESTSSAGESTSVTNTAANELVQVNGVADADRDGLLDEDEASRGTKVDVADTDGDGLGDGEEVRIYKTDPKRPDSDGDGNPDGVEVEKGYNPNGSGALLDFTTARQNLTQE